MGELPDQWKESIIVLIYKNPINMTAVIIKEYPISILSRLSR
jgi:hypothetical protein